MKKIVLVFLLIISNVSAQSTKDTVKTEKQLTLVTGINFWKNALFAEIGIAKYNNGRVGYHPFSSAYFFSTEVNLLTGKNFIIAPKIGGWFAGGSGPFAIGTNLIYYTDLKNSNLYFRPEIGFGLMRIKVVYGYNARLTKVHLEGIPKSNIGIVYLLPLKKK
jgi:hypothetical protein